MLHPAARVSAWAGVVVGVVLFVASLSHLSEPPLASIFGMLVGGATFLLFRFLLLLDKDDR